jgi:hypothetical protein
VLAVNRLFPYLKQMKKITITDEEVSSPYKIEDIHASRQIEFEREVEKKQMEMESYLTLKKPQQVNFSDNNYEEKIGSMELLISEKIAQRNSEILPPIQESEQWLQPKETSIKSEKKVTWIDGDNTNNIFQKLKKVQDEKKYIEQQSNPLPEIKKEIITHSNTQTINIPIIPKNELVTQINELNKKVDAIYDLLVKLTKES